MKRVQHPLPSHQALGMIAGFFAALSDPMRIKIVHALMSGEKNVNALTEITGNTEAASAVRIAGGRLVGTLPALTAVLLAVE